MFALYLHAACVFYMTGVIWFAQVIQYPLLKLVDQKRYGEYYTIHLNRIVRMVLPVIVVQLGTAASLFFAENIPLWFGSGLLAMSVFNFCYTAYISISIYRQMGFGYSEELIDRLLVQNWARTTVWTVHSVFILIFAFFVL